MGRKKPIYIMHTYAYTENTYTGRYTHIGVYVCVINVHHKWEKVQLTQ